ncbi:hypothetical protein RCL_jg2410.t1 [Rhizophagus clarus]|uniref:Uncharacterized protein n=1 Tax=Rhizophagus clarus TaxID=94130 RepID=A0A8H3QTG8_9GLOM|nr:hypothetical protein RCL_jg2410.t1 [Rhizophagus clarus]
MMLQKVKAYESDDYNNIVDKLVKEVCNKEYLSLTFRYIKDKFDDLTVFDFKFNSFKTKLHAEELPIQDNLYK